MHILVIQSNRSILLGVAHLVRTFGHSVETAKSVSESTSKVAPDLLIIDERSIRSCGLEAVKCLWQNVGLYPEVILTLDSGITMNQYRNSHGIDVMPQPLDPSQLEARLKRASNNVQAIV